MSELFTEETLDDLPPPEGVSPTELNKATENSDDPEAPHGRFANGKPRKNPSKATGGKVGRPRKNEKVTISPEELADQITETFGLPVAGFSPLMFAVVDDRSEKLATALINVGNNSPSAARVLNKFIAVSSYREFVIFPIALAIAMLVEFKRLAPTAAPAEKLGITELYYITYPQQENVTDNMNGSHAQGVSGL